MSKIQMSPALFKQRGNPFARAIELCTQLRMKKSIVLPIRNPSAIPTEKPQKKHFSSKKEVIRSDPESPKTKDQSESLIRNGYNFGTCLSS